MTILVKNKHTLEVDEFRFRCSVGKNGFNKKKLEGDLATPKGKFNLGDIYYKVGRTKEAINVWNKALIGNASDKLKKDIRIKLNKYNK